MFNTVRRTEGGIDMATNQNAAILLLFPHRALTVYHCVQHSLYYFPIPSFFLFLSSLLHSSLSSRLSPRASYKLTSVHPPILSAAFVLTALLLRFVAIYSLDCHRKDAVSSLITTRDTLSDLPRAPLLQLPSD